jgi:glycosyltransferase involved in cell wall biosynthesis
MEHVLFIQFGNYAEAFKRFRDNGPETYRDQKLSVDFVAQLANGRKVTTLSLASEVFREELSDGLFAAGLPLQAISQQTVRDLFDEVGPSHVVIRTPQVDFINECGQRGIPTLTTFADIFERRKLKQFWSNHRLHNALAKLRAPAICNHSLNASMSLVSSVGIPASRVIPWDWSRLSVEAAPKDSVQDPSQPKFFYAGMLSEEKGVGDCLKALAILKKSKLEYALTLAGPGNIEHWQEQARKLGLENQVRFIGQISHAKVREEMIAHDFVIVPSRHSYGEGLPNTIYEALASRSVLLMSDHPAFQGRLKDGDECLIFPANDPTGLSVCMQEATSDIMRYRRISENSKRAHDNLYVGLQWTELVDQFLTDPENKTEWVEGNSLANY